MTRKDSLSIVFKVIIVFAVAFLLSFFLFTLGYGAIHVILQFFFNFTLPFSWGYSLGAGLIFCVIATLTGGIRIKMS